MEQLDGYSVQWSVAAEGNRNHGSFEPRPCMDSRSFASAAT